MITEQHLYENTSTAQITLRVIEQTQYGNTSTAIDLTKANISLLNNDVINPIKNV